MKLYHFNPNTYGQQAFVCAENKELAIQALRLAFNKSIKNDPGCKDYYNRKFREMSNCLEKYTIEDHDPNHVCFAEIS